MSADNVPSPSTDDALSHAESSQSQAVSRTSAAISNYLRAAVQVGDDAEENYQRALADLRRYPEAATVQLAAAYGSVHAHDYPLRWALVFAAGELKHQSALAFLSYVVETPIPPEPREPSHGFSIVGEETILRTTAIEAIGHLASEGSDEAVDTLLRALKQPSISIRRAAVQALRETKRFRNLRDRIRAELPPDQHFLLTLSTPRVDRVPQVPDPRRFLSEQARSIETEPAPTLPGGVPKTRKPPRRR
ncbi:MAG: HEAT repeat domain-containing protein [Mycobacterium sp.]